MEFPDLGKQCSLLNCKQLDFLPFTCPSCKNVFCHEHRKYATHKCQAPRFIKDKRADVCPLCSKPVAVLEGENVDQKISEHIEAGCKSVEAERKRNSRCNAKRCRVHELMPIKCNRCNLQFCLKHRFPADHQCNPSSTTTSGAAAIARQPSTIVRIPMSKVAPPKLVTVKN